MTSIHSAHNVTATPRNMRVAIHQSRPYGQLTYFSSLNPHDHPTVVLFLILVQKTLPLKGN